jgi:multiple antibiotic resistance protein
MIDWHEYWKLLVALWALVQPIGAVPIFLSLTEDRPAERNQVGFIASVAVGVILIVSVFVGQELLDAFGITIPSFRIAGGLLILLAALTMIHMPEHRARETPTDKSDAAARDSVAIVPLAIPILAGPGAISTVIVYANKSTALHHDLLVCAIIVVVAASIFVVFRLALPIASLMGQTGMRILTQIMGLLIAAVAVEFITQGLAAIFPGWQSP